MDGALTKVEIEADDTGDLVVRWEPIDRDIEIAIGPTPDVTAHAHAMRVPAGEGSARLTELPAGRHYVSVRCDGTVLVAAERLVRFVGAPNFRDLGGYPTASGGWTRWGLVFRSCSLHELTTEDLTAFDALGVRTIYDLRRDDERAREPGPRPVRSLPMPSRFDGMPDLSPLRERADGEQWLLDDYHAMVADGGPVFGALLTALSEADGTPAVFHCAGGKDRTGLSAALLLSWLGVDRETVLDDYELTGRYLSARDTPDVVDRMVEMGIGRPAAEALLGTHRWVLADALDFIDSEYGGVETYLRGPAAMTSRALDDLRARLVV